MFCLYAHWTCSAGPATTGFFSQQVLALGRLALDGRDGLQQQLSGQNCPPESTSEDLLLQAWAKWGPACLQNIIGDFSFALWDSVEKTWWCARDFIGARPFFYAHVPGVFCFSNTLQILPRVPELSGQLDETFLGDFLTHGWNLDLERTVYRDIHRLPSGHLLKFSINALTVRRFRKLPIEEPHHLGRPEEYLQTYLDLLNLTDMTNSRGKSGSPDGGKKGVGTKRYTGK